MCDAIKKNIYPSIKMINKINICIITFSVKNYLQEVKCIDAIKFMQILLKT